MLPSACSSRSRSPRIQIPSGGAARTDPPRSRARASNRAATSPPAARRRARRPAAAAGPGPPGDHEQVLGQLDEAVGLLRRGRQRGTQLVGRAAAPQRQLQLGPQDPERGAQLMAGVGRELPLAGEGGLEPVEHLVQRPAQPGDLVAGRRDGQALVGPRGRDARRPAAHRLDRPQRGGGDAPARDRGQHERHGPPAREQRAERPQRVVALPERGPDRDDPGPVGRPRRARPARAPGLRARRPARGRRGRAPGRPAAAPPA